MKNKIVLGLLVFVCIMGVFSNSSSANGNIDGAVDVTLNENHAGQLITDEDIDYYRFTLPADGKVDLNFRHNDLGTDDSGWHVQVIRYKPGEGALPGTETILTYFTSPGQNKDYTQSICLPAGTYYLRVSLYTYYYWKTQAINELYELNVGFTPGDSFEKEINDTPDLANDIEINTAYAGYLQDMPAEDIDYYRFTLPADGKVDLNFRHNDLGTDRSGWHVQVIRYKPGEGALPGTETILTYFTSLGNNKDYTRSICLPAGTYYLRVSLYKRLSSTRAINELYELNVGFTPGDSFEKEINDTLDLANDIEINTAYTGYLQDMPTEDIDYYRFTLPEDGKVDLNFRHNDLGTDRSGWHARVFKCTEDSESFVAETDLLNYISYGNNKDYTRSICLPAGNYYLRVSLYKRWNDSTQAINEPYQFNVKFTPGNAFEKEPNDSVKKANTMLLNVPYTGYLQTTLLDSTKDKDIYRFILPGEDTVSVNFRHNDLDTDLSGWRVRLFSIDGDDGILDPMENELLNVVSKGKAINEDYEIVNMKGGEYYLEVSLYSYYSDSTQAVNKPYILTVNSKLSSPAEPPLPDFDIWETKNTDDINKIWKVKFSGCVDVASLDNNIFVTDNCNERIACTLTVLDGGETVAVASAAPYSSGREYRLYITCGVCSKYGNHLRNAIVMPFVVS